MRQRLRNLFGRSPSPFPTPPNTAPTSVILAIPSYTKSGSGILADAFDLLTLEERETVRAQLSSSTFSVDTAVDEVYSTAGKLQHSCKEKGWQGQADKICKQLDKMKAMGDVVANVDPVHIGLPWAGIRLLLEVRAR